MNSVTAALSSVRLKLLLILFVFLSTPIFASTYYQRLEDQGLSQYWLKLLHYKKRLFGGFTSLVDGPMFFVHPEGKTNPQKELEATIKLFSDPDARVGYFKMPGQCVFVERHRFLKKAGLTMTPDIKCPDFEEWKSALNAKSIMLVFSSSFTNNPASFFGHTFIRFKSGVDPSLLDYSANYSAITPPNPFPLVYAFKGLFGGYRGRFTLEPYYIKVNKYNNSENRDLYEYELNLTEEGRERIVNHLWELYSTTYFNYYFIDENCSYVLSKVIELGDETWDLSKTHHWYYLPSDSVHKLVNTPDAVIRKSHRPSLKKRLAIKYNTLSSAQQELFFEAKNGRIPIHDIHDTEVLDALIAYWNFRKRKDKKKFTDENKSNLRKALLHRAQIDKPPLDEPTAYDRNNQPEFGHQPSKISMGVGRVDQQTFSLLSFKSGLHDLLLNDKGFEPFSQFEFVGADLEINSENNHAALSRLLFLDIISLTPYAAYDPRVSWRAKVDYGRIYDLECSECFRYHTSAAFGGTFYLGSERTVVYTLLGAFAELSKYFKENRRAGPSWEWSILSKPCDFYRFQIKQEYKTDALNDDSEDYFVMTEIGQSISWSRNSELRFQYQTISQPQNAQSETTIVKLQFGCFF